MKRLYIIIYIIALTAAQCHAQSVTDNNEITVTDSQGENETIEFPEAMDYNLDSLLHQYMSRTYLDVDADCNYKDENRTYDKETYINRLQRLPTEMEMAYNDVVQQFIDRYSGRLRRSVSFMLGAANFYFPIFEEALEVYQLPLELKYLPIIESALNPTATSRVGAAGLWQFMLGTARQYGLEVTTLVDERRDPLKSSYAAAHYLKDLYDIFGDWNLVIAAYNCGPENINKAIHRAGGEKDYWHIYPYLPKETRGYVPAFIAANYIMNYYCEHNICPMTSRLPMATDTIVVTKNVHLEQISAVCEIEMEALKALNPQYRRDIVPGFTAPQTIRMPLNSTTKFIDLEDSVYNYSAEALLKNRAEVIINDAKQTPRTPKGGSGARYVTVQKGQTLGGIAKANGTTVAALRRLNGIKGNNIRAGKKLRVR